MQYFVNVDVNDLDEATRFYTTVFGLTVGRRFHGGAIELLGAATPIYLLVKDAGTPASNTMTEQRRYERHWTPVQTSSSTTSTRRSGRQSRRARSSKSRCRRGSGGAWR
jgi:catechol 2,3-dioxygenase-like lactoylglutathione lyase family enzyme